MVVIRMPCRWPSRIVSFATSDAKPLRAGDEKRFAILDVFDGYKEAQDSGCIETFRNDLGTNSLDFANVLSMVEYFHCTNRRFEFLQRIQFG